MPSPSKENKMLDIFFNYPSRHWHFEELLKKGRLSRDKANKWLKRMVNEGIVKRIKEKGKMPYYIGNYESPSYRNRKRLYALNLFYDSGFLNHLQTLSKAKAVIIFGSMARSDWYKDSDIDLFIYGDDEDFEKGKYELKLKREIQLFSANSKEKLKKMGAGLIQNIMQGYFVKGNIEHLGVRLYA